MTNIPEEPSPCDAGFTVVDLLIAFVLLSLLSLLLMNALQFGFKSWERNAAHGAAVEEVLTAQNTLRRYLANSYPMFSADARQGGNILFSGDDKSLSFIADAPSALGGSHARFTLSAAGQGSRTDFVLRVAPELTEASDLPSAERAVLVQDVSSVQFAYFGKRRGESTMRWHGSWARETALPQLVRLRVSFPPGSIRMWPEMIVAPVVGADVSCIYDPLTKYCRGR